MTRRGVSAGARKLNLGAARRRRPVSAAEWERRDLVTRVARLEHHIGIVDHHARVLRDLADENRAEMGDLRDCVRQIRSRVSVGEFLARLALTVAIASAIHALLNHYGLR